MVDNQNRLQIPEEFREYVETGGDKKILIYFYYSSKEKLYYISSKKDEYIDEQSYITHRRQLDKRFKVFIPSDIIKQYNTKKIICGVKKNLIFLVPMEEV